ncbi:MAG TPA: cytochrome o ubiquinol oxidase subunit I [Acidobacteriaceae bacterium]|nr:cytochrome o ubiquinol oxidase subunit I [Acidobacteriaceae bacterium]
MLGKLSLSSIPLDNPIDMGGVGVMVVLVICVLGAVTYLGKWQYLWKEWVTSVDHKRIGIMYIILAMVMLLRGFTDAAMMRSQLAFAGPGSAGYLPPSHYDQIFTAHGVIMIFFVAMPFIVGLMNFAMPLQIGARDVAFPYMNSVSLWLTAAGALLVNLALVFGAFARTGWMGYPPLSELRFSPGVGVDYYIWALQIAGIGTLLSSINMIVTVLKLRAPGMKLMMMPIFSWATLCTNVLIAVSFPVLTATLALLTLDRYLGLHFFTNTAGGDPMLYISLFWTWGHPEVYILILPLFGVYSEIVPTFSGKKLFGYTSMVYATVAITVISFLVWVHHFFTMGSGGTVNAFFGVTTMIISIPTGVKLFNWLFTMFRGRIRFETPMLWTLAFMVTFTIGGMTGVLLAIPPADFVLHNSEFLIAHFHNVIIGGVLFGAFAAYTYWFPKAFGFKLDERLGKLSIGLWVAGFYLAFMPLYALGFMGMTRRLNHYSNPDWQPFLIVAACGAAVIALGIATQVVQIVVSIRKRSLALDTTGDPWNGRTLEWATTSPPPFYNFAQMPDVTERDEFWKMKKEGWKPTAPETYEPIHMPRNTGTGFIIAFFAVVFGFAMIWHIWWLAALGFIGIAASMIIHSYNKHRDMSVSAETIEDIERRRFAQLPQQV